MTSQTKKKYEEEGGSVIILYQRCQCRVESWLFLVRSFFDVSLSSNAAAKHTERITFRPLVVEADYPDYH